MSGSFQAITVVGGVLPPAMLGRIQTGDLQDRAGLAPSSYFLSGRETIGDAASRSWSYLKGVWQDWQDIDTRKGGTGPGTGDARQRWLLILLRELGYGQVPPAGSEIEDRSTYPVSHLWGSVPIHLLGPRVQLDKRNPGVDGAAKAPQKMLQELLNHSSEYLWGILSNGLKLRLLRDSTALAGSAYIEFDLETIFTSELYPEFQLLWQIFHQSRLAPRDAESGPENCWLESWRSESVESGSRALDRLGVGVQHALEQLGTGFLRHPDNSWLVDALRTDNLSRHDFHKALLRTAYRLLFCFVVEDRGALHILEASAEARRRYTDYFSTRRLRDLSRKHDGGPHADLWQTQKLVLIALGGDGQEALGLPALGGLFDPDSRAKIPATQPGPDLALGCELANRDLLRAVRSLAWVKNQSGRIEPVDYRHLGAEELGSVYESLLELVPRLDLESKSFELENVAGNERKVTGSYYTPPNLVSALLDTALDPLLDEAVRSASDLADAERRLLELTVCDPASGSGGFLVAAARRIARRLAEIRAGEDEPTPEEIRHSLHDVVDRCIYGVDMNDLAAELAKVSLWLEAMEPGKPLTFLDSRIKIGNSLIGATPALMAAGIPDEAFKPLEGDLKTYASEVRKINKAEAKAKVGQYIQHLGQDALDFGGENSSFEKLIADRERFNQPATSAEDTRRLAREYAIFDASKELQRRRLEADAWCASFVWPLDGEHTTPPTNSVFRTIGASPNVDSLASTISETQRLQSEYRFFHWHLEFPEVFGDPEVSTENGSHGWPKGFSCLIGNPPWERVKLQEPEYFASRDPEISNAPTAAARRRLISALADPETGDPILYRKFLQAKRKTEGQSHFIRNSKRFPLCGHGDVNTYAVFAEAFGDLVMRTGQAGFIVKTGLVTDDTYKRYPAMLAESGRLHSLFDFENRANGFKSNGKPRLYFEAVDSREKFSLVTVGGKDKSFEKSTLAFFVTELSLRWNDSFLMSTDEIRSINPNTRTLPIFRTRHDAEITLGIYKRVPVLVNENDPVNGNPWNISFMRMFDTTNDSELFRSREQLEQEGFILDGTDFVQTQSDNAKVRMKPLVQGRLFHLFDHRFTSFNSNQEPIEPSLSDKSDSTFEIMPKMWISETQIDAKVSGWTRPWFFVFRNIGRATDVRSFIGSVVPRSGTTNSAPIMLIPGEGHVGIIQSLLSSLAFDYLVRQKLGGANMNFFIVEQVPVPTPEMMSEDCPWDTKHTFGSWISTRASELTYTSDSLSGLAEECAWGETPFIYDTQRRLNITAELNAGIFHLYAMSRDDVETILDSFSVLAADECKQWGEYRSKRLILELFDAIQQAVRNGVTYESPISPSPGDGARHNPREVV